MFIPCTVCNISVIGINYVLIVTVIIIQSRRKFLTELYGHTKLKKLKHLYTYFFLPRSVNRLISKRPLHMKYTEGCGLEIGI